MYKYVYIHIYVFICRHILSYEYIYEYVSTENQAQHPVSPTPGSTAGVERMKERFLKVKEELKSMKDASSKKERYI
jgi:hypothetical protein